MKASPAKRKATVAKRSAAVKPIGYRPSAPRRAVLEAEAQAQGVPVERVLDFLVDRLADARRGRSMPKARPPVFGHDRPAARDVTPNFKKGRGDG